MTNDTSTIEYCKISKGKSSWGGGVYIDENYNVDIENSLITHNIAEYTTGVTGQGGGIYIWKNNNVSILNTSVENNEATY